MQTPTFTSRHTNSFLTASVPGWVGVAGGIWLIVAPFVLSYSDVDKPFYTDIIVGAAEIILFGFCALAVLQVGTALARQVAGFVALLAGACLIMAPFVLSYTDTTNAFWNDLISGAAFVVLAAYTTLYHTRHFTDYA
ncbi:MAG TPA: SPW repeat protein [Chloroflexia bacterium]|nr:SPW repeat protein [Chloroflexia bacterium]